MGRRTIWCDSSASCLGLAGVCMLLQRFASDLSGANVVGSGGYAGALGLAVLEKYFSAEGITILIATCVAAGLLIAGELSLVWLAFAILFLPFRLVGRIFRRHSHSEAESDVAESPARRKTTIRRPKSRARRPKRKPPPRGLPRLRRPRPSPNCRSRSTRRSPPSRCAKK